MSEPMLSRRVYLDHNATAPVHPQARSAALAAMDDGGNPSSVHAEGRSARACVETARGAVAALVGARPEHVVFTSGGTEAANLALVPGLRRRDARGNERLLTAATEHAAILNGHRFASTAVEVLPVLADGTLDLRILERALRGPGLCMVALQAANNETGVLQPVAAAAALVRAHGGLLVCDAVQAPGRIPCDRAALPADVLLLSAHKLGGLPGAGALVFLCDDLVIDTPLVRGGGQERGLRAGTENVPAIAAFGAVAALAAAERPGAHMTALRDRFETELRRLAPDAVLFGADADRLPNTSCFAVPGIPAERLMMALDLGGIAVSSGSACASGKVGRSHVLEAMAVEPDLRGGAIRVSFGWGSAETDVSAIIAVLGSALERMARRLKSAA